MGYVELPDAAPAAGGKVHGTIVLDEQELRVTVSLLKDALAEFTREVPNGVSHTAAVPMATPAAAALAPAAAAAQQAGATRAAAKAQQPSPAATGSRAGLPAHLAGVPQHLQQQQQHKAQPPMSAPPKQQQQQQQALRPPPQPQQLQPPQPRPQPVPQQQPPAAPRPALVPVAVPAPAPVAVPVAQPAAAAPRAMPPQHQQQQRPPPQPQQQQQGYGQAYQAPPQAQAPAPPPRQQQQQQQAVGAVHAAPSPASSHWCQCFSSDAEEHGHQAVTAVAYAKALPGLPGGDGHSGWLVTSSKGLLNLWETNRAAAGEENVLLCMHSQAVDFSSTKLVLEPSTKLLFGASVSREDVECVSVHNLDVEMGLLAYRYRFGPPKAQPRHGQRLLQQVVSLHGINPGVRNTIMTAYGERLLLFSTKDSAQVPANSLVHTPKMHCIAHPGSVVTAMHTSAGIEGVHNLISGAADGNIHIWDLQQPPRDNSPAMRLYRHTRDVTGLAQITDERLVSGSLDGTVMLWDLRYPQGPLFTHRPPGNAPVLKIAPGPWGDVMAVATAQGLHCVELFDFDAPMSNITAFPLQQPYTDLVFNAVTHDLYAGTNSGALAVFSRRA